MREDFYSYADKKGGNAKKLKDFAKPWMVKIEETYRLRREKAEEEKRK